MADRPGTEAELATAALAHLGEPAVSSLADTTPRAVEVAKMFGLARDIVLRLGDWNFASTYSNPAADPVASPGRLTFRHPMPPECVAVRECPELDDEEWGVEGGMATEASVEVEAVILVASTASPLVRWTRRVTNTALWDPLALHAWSLQLAALVAPSLGYRSLAPALQLQSDELCRRGQRADAKERARGVVNQQTSWIAARGLGSLRRS